MSDEKEIRDVMKAERRRRTEERLEADLKGYLLKAIKDGNEEQFMQGISDLGHKPGSEKYEYYQKRWRALVGRREP